MEEESLYDEFGNYIGPEGDDFSDEEDEDQELEREGGIRVETTLSDEDSADGRHSPLRREEDSSEMAIEKSKWAVVPHEEKQYYPDAEDVFGAETEVIYHDEDAQPITEPIVPPPKKLRLDSVRKDVPETVYEKEFMWEIMNSNPSKVRMISVAGHIHHGMTTFVDTLVRQTHVFANKKEYHKYTHVRDDERDRGISIKAKPMTFLLPDLHDASHVIHLMDVPGHVNFSDELRASLRLSDGIVVAVDACEGVMIQTERILKAAASLSLPVVLLITKLDRLIVELKLPPRDAYFKLRHTIEKVNEILGEEKRVSPHEGNVCFSSGEYCFSFTLKQFAHLYNERHGGGGGMNPVAFSKRLWGDVYFDEDTRRFVTEPPSMSSERTFVKFVLEPLYKLFSRVIGEEGRVLVESLASIGIDVSKKETEMDTKELLSLVCQRFFQTSAGFVDMVRSFIPSPVDGNRTFMQNHWTGPTDSPRFAAALSCDSRGPLLIQTTKMYRNESGTAFYTLGRILSGTVHMDQDVIVLGEGYSPDEDEDMSLEQISAVMIPGCRYRYGVTHVGAGNWILLEGVDQTILKTSTIVSQSPMDQPVDTAGDMYVFHAIPLTQESVVKVAVEPLKPAELPKMVEGIRKLNKSYPGLVSRVEESGEHVLFGTGELYLDCVLMDLRLVFGELEVNVSDPVVSFNETVVETSAVKCFADTPNKKNRLTIIAEPLDRGLGEDIEARHVSLLSSKKEIGEFFKEKYGWDLLAARSVWAFGPNMDSPNLILDDTLPTEVDKKLVNSLKQSIVQGFQWATREGPLCGDPIRNVKFKLLDATIAEEQVLRGPGQVIPTARRVIYSSFMTAQPRLMEPVYQVEIELPFDSLQGAFNVLARRRGHVIQDYPKPGTPMHIVMAYLPVIESFGFETDLRVHTQGQAFAQSVFNHWSIVPGDPLDKNIVLQPLEPAPIPHLARDFMVKTRRRKGMPDDVSVSKFFDDPMLLELAKSDPELSDVL
eukprot:TRINITY_DN81575_c0_g1_i1.p1 TRINITY_DN81575_c0_g1~~TRINITY_DN81575_c0_g1_i1.p1  ORF type:complete len:994 (+),score=294.35 TRINITY_DN81575_c0_g1_i1:258-3239(+)